MSGGQTGADRAALDAAIAAGIPYGGWCPAGGWAEDEPTPPGLLARYPGLRATPMADPAMRTRLNVRDSDATLIVRPADTVSPGTDLTEEIARELGRPCLVSTGDPGPALEWLEAIGTGLVLNVAGLRESEHPGIYELTRALLEAVGVSPA